MKSKIIVAAIAALCAASSFAAPLNPNTTVPQQTYYIGGATAQAPAIIAVASDLFAVPADMVTIYQGSSTQYEPTGLFATNGASTGQNVIAFLGMSKVTASNPVSKALLVVYNNTNGSMAGMTQLLAPTLTAQPEAKVLTTGTGAVFTNVAGNVYKNLDASHDVFTMIDLVVSDVYPTEANLGVLAPGKNGNLSFSQINTQMTALEGFGVIVNPALYAALQTSQGLGNDLTAANQPSISRTMYAGIVSADGFIKSAASLLNNSDATDLTLERRVDSSGTQSASNIYFLNNVCGDGLNAGALTPTAGADAVAGTFEVFLQGGTGGVKNGLTAGNAAAIPAGTYGIGVVSLENTPKANANSWQFVKLDGVSPSNWGASGTTLADPKQRAAFASGAYTFATEMTANYRKGDSAFSVGNSKVIIADLSDSTKHDLVGIAYEDGLPYVAGGKQAFVAHGGNNCQPLRDTQY